MLNKIFLCYSMNYDYVCAGVVNEPDFSEPFN